MKRPAEDPSVVVWEITQACRLACRHCRTEARAARDPRELTTEEGFRLIDEVAKFRKPLFVLAGGDPLQREDLLDFVRRAADRGVETSLSLSATEKVTADKLSALKRAGVRRVSLGFDSFDPVRHDSFRGVIGSFAKTMQVARDARLAGIAVEATTVVGRHNKDELSAMAGLVKTLGAELWTVVFFVPADRLGADEALTSSEYEAALNELYDISKRSSFAVSAAEAPQFARIAAQRGRNGKTAPKASSGGHGFVFVSHTGEVYPSGFLPLSAGNVRSRPLVEIYRTSPLFRALRDQNALHGKCGACDYRGICGGSRARAYAMAGNLLAPDPLCGHTPVRSAPARTTR